MSDTSFMEGQEKIDDILLELGQKVESLIKKRKDISFIEDQLKEMTESERVLSREEIPQLLLSRGLSSITLQTGEKIDIIEKLTAAIPKDSVKRSLVLKWLINNGGDNLITQELKIEEPELKLIEYLQEEGIPFFNNHVVNTNSFKAFLNAKLGLKKGSLQELEIADIPKEANPFIYRETKIK